jgi:hypothetical protein
MRKSKKIKLNGSFVYGFLAISFLLMAISFIVYSFFPTVERIKDVPREWIYAYSGILGWYATQKEMNKQKLGILKERRGEYFVYLTWVIAGVIYPFYYYGVIQRFPANLHVFFLYITGVYAGGKILENILTTED